MHKTENSRVAQLSGKRSFVRVVLLTDEVNMGEFGTKNIFMNMPWQADKLVYNAHDLVSSITNSDPKIAYLVWLTHGWL